MIQLFCGNCHVPVGKSTAYWIFLSWWAPDNIDFTFCSSMLNQHGVPLVFLWHMPVIFKYVEYVFFRMLQYIYLYFVQAEATVKTIRLDSLNQNATDRFHEFTILYLYSANIFFGKYTIISQSKPSISERTYLYLNAHNCGFLALYDPSCTPEKRPKNATNSLQAYH